MKEKLVTSEASESINQDIMSISHKLDVISGDLKQIKTQILLNSLSTERIVHHPLNYYIAEDKMMQLKVGMLILSKRKKMLLLVHNLDNIREIHLNSKHGGITNLFHMIFNNSFILRAFPLRPLRNLRENNTLAYSINVQGNPIVSRR